MKKIVIFCLFLLAKLFFAQQEINTAFADQMNATFAPLDKTKIQHGVLLDQAMEFTNVPAFNGTLTDSTYVNTDNLSEIYNTLLMGRIRTDATTGFVSPDIFDATWFSNRSPDYIALSGLYFKYNQFAGDAITANKLTLSNGKFYDKFVNGVWQNPYTEGKTFAMTTPVDLYTGKSLKVKLPSATFYSNYPSEVQKVETDFADGRGYRLMQYNQLVNVNYAQAGNYIWKYKLTLTNGQILYSQSKIKIQDGATINPNFGLFSNAKLGFPSNIWSQPVAGMSNLYTFGLTSGATYDGLSANAQIFVDDAGGDHKITKPLIVIEGFDMSTIFSPETKYSTEDYTDFQKSIFKTNSNLSILLSGNGEFTYGDQQYDVIYLNWDNGVDYIERNALVVEDLIKLIKNNIDPASTNKIVIMGQSMGGVVTRFALKDLETQGYNHNVGLFVSDDSPQQGANIPLSYQYLFRNAVNQVMRSPVAGILIPLFPKVQKMMTILDQPAVKEMVINRVDSGYNLDNVTTQSFYTMLKNKGYPNQYGIRNIAISNGSECGNLQNFTAGDHLITYSYYKKLTFVGDLLSLIYLPSLGNVAGFLVDPSFFAVGFLARIPGNSKFYVNLEDRALYPTSGNKIHDFKVQYTKKILWLFPITVSIINKQLYQPNSINKHFDNYGGGYINIGDYAGSLNISGLYIRDKFSLVPTPSALDIGGGFTTLDDSNYKTSYTGANPPSAPLNSPFTNFTTAFTTFADPSNNNQQHISFNARNGNWLAAELTSTSFTTNCTFMCSGVQISGSSPICGTSANYSVPAGAESYNWSIVGGNGQITLSENGTPNITLTLNGTYNGSITLSVTFGDTSGKCGLLTLTKTIWIGSPIFHIEPDASNSNNYVIFNAIPDPSTISFEQMGVADTNIVWKRLDNGQTRTGASYSAHAPGQNWSFDVEVKATNSCGTFKTYATITPPPAMPCETFVLAQTNQNNNYTILKSVDPECPIINGKTTETYQIKVANSMGVIIVSKTGVSFDLSTYPTGMYVVNIQKNNQTIINQTIIKN